MGSAGRRSSEPSATSVSSHHKELSACPSMTAVVSPPNTWAKIHWPYSATTESTVLRTDSPRATASSSTARSAGSSRRAALERALVAVEWTISVACLFARHRGDRAAARSHSRADTPYSLAERGVSCARSDRGDRALRGRVRRVRTASARSASALRAVLTVPARAWERAAAAAAVRP